MILQVPALVIALGSVSLWLASGPNRGWTKTSVPVKHVDEVTGIEAVEYQRRFVPGVDFLSASLLAAGVLGGAAFLFRNRQPTKENL